VGGVEWFFVVRGAVWRFACLWGGGGGGGGGGNVCLHFQAIK
jgi:hypothetical protein